MLGNTYDFKQLEEWGLDTIKHNWEELDYIDEEQDAPELKKEQLLVTIPDEYLDEKNKIRTELADWLLQNFAGCEVK